MALIFGMGATEIGLILIIALIVLGPQKVARTRPPFWKDARRSSEGHRGVPTRIHACSA